MELPDEEDVREALEDEVKRRFNFSVFFSFSSPFFF
jgi:hypothetical protein